MLTSEIRLNMSSASRSRSAIIDDYKEDISLSDMSAVYIKTPANAPGITASMTQTQNFEYKDEIQFRGEKVG